MYSDTSFLGPALFIYIVIWLVVVGVGFLVSYWVIRLSVFHAMKAHTRWLQSGQR